MGVVVGVSASGVAVAVAIGSGVGVAVASSIIASTVGGAVDCRGAAGAVGSSSPPHATESIANMAASTNKPKARFIMCIRSIPVLPNTCTCDDNRTSPTTVGAHCQ